MKYKGYCILEILVSVTILSVISTLSITMLLKFVVIYKKSLQNSIYTSRIEELEDTMHCLLTENNVFYVDSKSNMIRIYKRENGGILVKEIRLKKGNIIVDYYREDSLHNLVKYGTYNTLLKTVDKFTTIKKGKLIYYKIKKEDVEIFTTL